VTSSTFKIFVFKTQIFIGLAFGQEDCQVLKAEKMLLTIIITFSLQENKI